MPWTRRRSKWPLWSTLSILFLATLVAPWVLPRLRAVRRDQHSVASTALEVSSQSSPPRIHVAGQQLPPSAPKLPPLARTKQKPKTAAKFALGDVAPRDLSIPEPSSFADELAAQAVAQPGVATDDYVVVHEPLVDPETVDLELLAPTPSPDALAEAAQNSLVDSNESQSETAETGAPAPRITNSRSILVHTHSAAASSAGTLEVIPTAEPVVDAAPVFDVGAPAKVMVESESDRLAMAPPPRTTEPTFFSASSEPTPAAAAPLLLHEPATLLGQLANLASMPQASQWAEEVRSNVVILQAAPATPETFAQTIASLRAQSLAGLDSALHVSDAATQSAWLRTSRALERRLGLWDALADPAAAADAGSFVDDLTTPLAELMAETADSSEGTAWREYLRLEELSSLASAGGEHDAEARRQLALDVLARISDASLTAAQRQFMSEPPVTTLVVQLRQWAIGPATLDDLAELIERYESKPTGADAATLAAFRIRYKSSSNPKLQSLGQDLNRNYRNANLRVAFSQDLLTRLIPKQEPVKTQVHEQIAGTDVRGRSQTETNVALRMKPNAQGWQFELAATGDVSSQTYSESWPARVRNSSKFKYEASKEIFVGAGGLRTDRAQATAKGRTDLVGVESGFDPLPIIGPLVESAARHRHDESRARAVSQVKAKVIRQARTRMDREADEKLHNLEARFESEVFDRLERFAVIPQPVDMSTTDQRAVVRLRLASDEQLAAHTPRPSAPADSVVSFQLHESALNNTIRGLGLDGRRLTIGELHTILSDKIARHAAAPPADLPQRAIVEFAPQDAIRVACRGDHIELVLNIVEIRKGRDSIKNVAVHAFFRPTIDGLDVKLVRDGGLQFDGRQLRTGQRMILHGVFGKLLRKNQEVPVLARSLRDDPRFAGLMVTQMVIDDGWVAMSIGPAAPERTAWRTRGAALQLTR